MTWVLLYIFFGGDLMSQLYFYFITFWFFKREIVITKWMILVVNEINRLEKDKHRRISGTHSSAD